MLIDASPVYLKKADKFVIFGAQLPYKDNKFLPIHKLAYSVFDKSVGDWSAPQTIKLPSIAEFQMQSGGSAQIVELDNGDLLVPISCSGTKTKKFACVLRLAFDGAKMTYKEHGNLMSVEEGRGLYEPSLIEVGGVYLLSLRNDASGYVARSNDGLHFGGLKTLNFDDGTNAGNYNTQTHWLKGGGLPYLVYTRKDILNSHIFRHRAPLFIARFDIENMCLVKSSERVAVPMRGARLGNFGVCGIDAKNSSYIVAAEWMQSNSTPAECVQYGSDNSIFVSEVKFEQKK